jgi:transcription initiation factor IIE alpha subunit
MGKNLWQKNCIKKTKIKKRRKRVTMMATGNKRKNVMICQRCGGRMIFEKFYDVNNVFFGWHCVICGEILDPVILLHRLSQDADLQIPEKEEEVMHLVKKYLHSKSKDIKGGQKGKAISFPSPLKYKISMN